MSFESELNKISVLQILVPRKSLKRVDCLKFVVGDEHGVPVRHNLQWVIVEDRHLPVSIHKPLNLREDCDYVS